MNFDIIKSCGKHKQPHSFPYLNNNLLLLALLYSVLCYTIYALHFINFGLQCMFQMTAPIDHFLFRTDIPRIKISDHQTISLSIQAAPLNKIYKIVCGHFLSFFYGSHLQILINRTQ